MSQSGDREGAGRASQQGGDGGAEEPGFMYGTLMVQLLALVPLLLLPKEKHTDSKTVKESSDRDRLCVPVTNVLRKLMQEVRFTFFSFSGHRVSLCSSVQADLEFIV